MSSFSLVYCLILDSHIHQYFSKKRCVACPFYSIPTFFSSSKNTFLLIWKFSSLSFSLHYPMLYLKSKEATLIPKPVYMWSPPHLASHPPQNLWKLLEFTLSTSNLIIFFTPEGGEISKMWLLPDPWAGPGPERGDCFLQTHLEMDWS